MKIETLSVFPQCYDSVMNESIMRIAQEKGFLDFKAHDLRKWTHDKHRTTDDEPYGGGQGLVMKCEPIFEATDELFSSALKKPYVIFLSPTGERFDDAMTLELAQQDHLFFICGHYEGIDERVLEEIVTDYVSIGDYVLTGGELPAMVMIDTISRLVPGVLHNDVSAEFESFQDNLLEYPQYSRPEEWRGKKVPPILLSGHHANIEKWRREQSILRTMERRPDLLRESNLTDKEKKWIRQVKRERKEAEKMK